MNLNIIEIAGAEYVVIPKKEYDKLRGQIPEGSADAIAYANASIASDLKAAREAGELTQGQLAKKIGKSQTMVSQVESGQERPPKGYVEAVMKACRLPKDWAAPRRKRK
jgi:ribosome-binding protein aMBF1 (putative translation factor)